MSCLFLNIFIRRLLTSLIRCSSVYTRRYLRIDFYAVLLYMYHLDDARSIRCQPGSALTGEHVIHPAGDEEEEEVSCTCCHICGYDGRQQRLNSSNFHKSRAQPRAMRAVADEETRNRHENVNHVRETSRGWWKNHAHGIAVVMCAALPETERHRDS